MSDPVVILGLGFTTQRLVRRLRQRGISVFAVARSPEGFTEFTRLGVQLRPLFAEIAKDIPRHAVLIHSIPPLDDDAQNSAVRALVAAIAPRRIVYISSTGVYGSQTEVNATTLAAPNDEKGHARVAEEVWLRAQCPSTIILRSAAIYGPDRGIHVRLREGKIPRGAGAFVSRIHVDDLVAILDAAVESTLQGAWPVADDCPAVSEEVAAWCASLMGLPLPEGNARSFPVAGRRVDGRKIRQLLGVKLTYASYREGIPASLEEENTQKADQ